MLSGLLSRISPAGSLAAATLMCLSATASVPIGLAKIDPALFVALATPLSKQPAGLAVPTGAPLRYDGGVMLRAWVKRFGGLSGIVAHRGELLLVSDAGAEIRLRPRWGLSKWHGSIGPLPPECFPGSRKQDRDSESLAIDPATGSVWVGLESINSICRYGQGTGKARRAAPIAMADWPRANGPESLTRLRNGRFVAIAEGASDGKPGVPVLVFSGDPLDAKVAVQNFRFVPPEGFRPVDVVEGPDGQLLVVVRGWRAALPVSPRYAPLRFSARIVQLPPIADWSAAKPVTGTEILRIADGDLDDNYEGIATSNENGQTFVWLVSDNNYSPFQRNLLLRFRWTGQVMR